MAPIGDGVLNVTFTAPMTCFDGSGISKTKATEIFETENVISENVASEITVSENEVSQHEVSEDDTLENAITEKLSAKQYRQVGTYVGMRCQKPTYFENS